MKTLTVSSRIVGGFSLLLAITLILGGFSAWRMGQAGDSATLLAKAVAPQAEITSNLAQASAKVQLAARTYGFTGDKAYLDAATAALGSVEADLEGARKLSEAQPSLTALAAGVKDSTAALAEYRRQFDATRQNLEALARIRESLDLRAAEFVRAIELYIADQNQNLAKEITAGLPADKVEERRWKVEQANLILATGNAIRIANFKSQALRNPEFIEKAEAKFAEIDGILKVLVPATRTEAQRVNLAKVDESARAYREGVRAFIANFAESTEIMKARTQAAGRFDAAVDSVLEVSIQKTTRFSTESAASLGHTTWMVAVGVGLAIVAGIVASFLIVHSLNQKLRETSSTVTQGAIQIAAASGQVSSTSQGLAEGASEQAASLEEISSSLEELASTTRNNAQSAGAAKTSADAARTAAEHGAAEMKKMEEAMTGIRQSSSDISKIIKTIDEIAFQTNILALNAAVEAARAGEAGAGFAVVADEVRTLAQRCAIAAKETTEKISDATTRSEQGAALSSSVSQSLGEIVAKARDVDRLVADVARASQEQSQGIEQVNIAVTQMDKVTQANAASAEEAASAAEELNAQSSELRHASEELAALVGLRTSGSDTPVAAHVVRPVVTTKRPGLAPVSKVAEKDFVESF